jgi:hypothetical protein
MLEKFVFSCCYVSRFSFGIGKLIVAIQIAMVDGTESLADHRRGDPATRSDQIKPNGTNIGCFGYKVALV